MRLLLLLAALVLSFAVAPSASACYKCESDCCVEATEDSIGSTVCGHSKMCLSGSGCACYNCSTSGGSCVGTAPSECDKEFDTCEEHQTFLVVPHGQLLDLPLLTNPPAVETFGPWTCGIV